MVRALRLRARALHVPRDAHSFLSCARRGAASVDSDVSTLFDAEVVLKALEAIGAAVPGKNSDVDVTPQDFASNADPAVVLADGVSLGAELFLELPGGPAGGGAADETE
jgi:hypothetical protein